MNSKNSETFAIPFISFHENQGFKLSPEAQQFLTSLPEDRQLGIISIVGKYRTGKSFFVNRVLLDQKKSGFQVGPTINPCTKGLWLWKKTIPCQNNKKMDVILIDTEGFGGMDENANHDSRIFLFSLLLSSYFIYNSVGSIDQNAINTLNLIINLAKEIQSKNTHSSQDESQFPSFLWIVRDFTLKLVDKSEMPITSKQYLENALELQKGTSDATQNKNKIRKLLKQFFQDRDCETMVRPTEAQKDLQKLDQIDNSLLRPQFVGQVQSIRNKIFTRVKPKKVNGQCLNGSMLVNLCKGYMKTINNGELPNVQSAWSYVCRSEGLKAINQASKILESCMDELMKNPVKPEDLQMEKEKIREYVMREFKKRAMNADQGHPDLIQKLQCRIDQYFTEFTRKNNDKWTQIYKQCAQEKLQKLRQKIYSEQYQSFNEFIADFEKLKAEFDNDTNPTVKNAQKWHHFNQLSQTLYKLAGETITEKFNNNLMLERQLLEQKLSLQQKDIQRIEHNLSLQQKENHKMEQKLSLQQRENQKIAQKLSHQQRENQRMKQNLSLQERENQRMEEKLSIQQEEKERLEQRLSLQQKEREKMKQQIERLSRNTFKSTDLEDYNEWLLEKAYLENQVAFLKNTMFENKKLHDALLIAFQRSVNCNEDEQEVIQSNRKCYKEEPKKAPIQANRPYNKEESSEELSQANRNCNKENLHITVSLNVVKDFEDRKKPYTEYIIQVMKNENAKSKVHKRYKEFTQLQQALINRLPSIKYPESSRFLCDFNFLLNSKKNMAAEERRKAIQQYLRDLCKIEDVRECDILKEFLGIQAMSNDSHHMKKSSVSKTGFVLQESNIKKRGLIN